MQPGRCRARGAAARTRSLLRPRVRRLPRLPLIPARSAALTAACRFTRRIAGSLLVPCSTSAEQHSRHPAVERPSALVSGLRHPEPKPSARDRDGIAVRQVYVGPGVTSSASKLVWRSVSAADQSASPSVWRSAPRSALRWVLPLVPQSVSRSALRWVLPSAPQSASRWAPQSALQLA